jgi:hypothetical protein
LGTMDKNKQLTYGLGSLGVLLGGIGAFMMMSEKGREILTTITHHLEQAPQSLDEWSTITQRELDRIQQTLDQIAARLTIAG